MKDVTVGFFSSGPGGQAAIALARQGTIVASRACGSGRRASQELLPVFDQLLVDSGIGLANVVRIGVCRGPGSFTGIRVGLATALGLARAAEAEVFGFTALELMCAAVESTELVAAIPAGRGDLYVARCSKEGMCLDCTAPTIITVAELDSFAAGLPIAVDEGYQDIATVTEGRQTITVVTAVDCACQAALRVAAADKSEYPAEPLYLRKSWAEEVRSNNDRS